MSEKLKVNPDIVLREEYDDWAVLFDPDSGKTNGISPTGAFIWKRLNGTLTKKEILQQLAGECDAGIPEEAAGHYDEFITALRKKGYLSV